MTDSNPTQLYLAQCIKGSAGLDGLVRLVFAAQILLALGLKVNIQISWTELRIQGGWLTFNEIRVKLPEEGDQNDALCNQLSDQSFWKETDSEFRSRCASLLTGAANDERTAFSAVFDTLVSDATRLRDAYVDQDGSLSHLEDEFNTRSDELLREIMAAIKRLK